MNNGVYFLFPEGSAWVAAEFRDGELTATANEAEAGTHTAARDSWADVVPQESDKELDTEDADEIVRAVFGEDVNVEMYVVTKPAPVYAVQMRDECGGGEVADHGTEQPDVTDIKEACRDWCREGEWGDDGAMISVYWSLTEDGDEIDEATRI